MTIPGVAAVPAAVEPEEPVAIGWATITPAEVMTLATTMADDIERRAQAAERAMLGKTPLEEWGPNMGQSFVRWFTPQFYLGVRALYFGVWKRWQYASRELTAICGQKPPRSNVDVYRAINGLRATAAHLRTLGAEISDLQERAAQLHAEAVAILPELA